MLDKYTDDLIRYLSSRFQEVYFAMNQRPYEREELRKKLGEILADAMLSIRPREDR